jgi:hypothetical protein
MAPFCLGWEKFRNHCRNDPLEHRCGYCIHKHERQEAIRARKARHRELKRKQNERLRNMSPGDRADYLSAEQDALQARIEANIGSMMGEKDSPTNFLTLPPEIREQIYRELESGYCSIEIVKSKPPKLDSYYLGALYRVCELLHHEIDRYLYKFHHVQFMTVPALELWRNKYAYRLALMEWVSLKASTPLPIVDVARKGNFSRLRTLWLERSCESKSGDYVWEAEHAYRRYGDRSFHQLTTRYADRWGDGPGLKPWNEDLLLIWRQPELIINNLEQFRGGMVQWQMPADGLVLKRGKYSIRFEVKEQPGTWFTAWRSIDVSVSDKFAGLQ